MKTFWYGQNYTNLYGQFYTNMYVYKNLNVCQAILDIAKVI